MHDRVPQTDVAAAHPRAHRGWFIAAIGSAILTFVASTTYSQLSAAAIDDEASSIIAEASPNIDRLFDARTSLLELQAVLDQYVDAARQAGPDRKTSHTDVDASRAKLALGIARYMQAHDAGHDAFYDEQVGRPLAALDVGIARVESFVDAGDPAGARVAFDRDVRTRMMTAFSGMWRLVEWNNLEVRHRVIAIIHARRRMMSLAFALAALSAGLVLGIGVVGVRRMHREGARIAARERELSRRAEGFEQFAARVAHDIGSPLGAVLLNVQLLERTRGTDEKTRAITARASRAVHRCRSLVDDLLAFARAGAHPDPSACTPVDSVVREVMEQIEEAEAGGLSIEAPALPSCAVACSKGVLTSILTNLLENAAKYTRESVDRRATVRVVARGSTVRFEVEDTGPGVPPAIASSIFDAYVRGPSPRQAGMGLGLATVKRLCEGHGGSAGLDAAPTNGCRFWFELPRAGTA